MNDRELLELAAKAAGKAIDPDRYDEDSGFAIRHMAIWWNPLNNDGDALRLAVKLHLLPKVQNADSTIWANECPYAVMRNAIVRAAAEIAKGNHD